MPFCPECRDKFEDRIEVCPDCKVTLVKKLPTPPKEGRKTDQPLVRIAIAPNEPIAKMWAGVLDEYDIRCLLKGIQLGGWAAYAPAFEMRHDIYVLESEVNTAKEILAPFLVDQEGGKF